MRRPSARFVRTVFPNQLLVSAAVLMLIVAIGVVDPAALQQPLFFAGLAMVFVATGLAAVVPWALLPRNTVTLLPVLDILATVAVREGQPGVGVGLFLVFPVIWLARDFGIAGSVTGVVLSVLLLWTGRLVRGGEVVFADLNELVLLPVTLAFVAASVHTTTKRSRAQRALLRQQTGLVETALARARRQEQLLDKVLNAVDFGVIAFDRDGTVTTINDAQRRLLDRFGADDGYVTPSVYQADRVTPYSESDRPIARAMRGEQFDNVVTWLGEPGTERGAFAVSSRRLFTSAGEFDGGVVVLREITAELSAIQARDDLVAAVSHELRSPLTSILGFLDLIADDPTISDDGRGKVDVVSRNAERLLRIVADILAAASDAEQTVELEREPWELGELVDEAVEGQRAFALDQHIQLERTDDISIVVDIDPLRIRQVLDNLITNGIKYNKQGGRVDVSVILDDAAVSVAVTDTGAGISERDQAKLFERYFRTDAARRSSVQGTGLGLGISRNYARLHGGDLTVDSVAGYGSTFVLRIPTSVGQTAAAASR